MDNKNLTLKWIDTLGNNKIVFERGIIDGTKNRGIYGIFIIDNKQKGIQKSHENYSSWL